MKRRHFLATGGLGLPAALTIGSPAAAEEILPALEHLAGTTATPVLLDLEERFKEPVIIDEITVFRRGTAIWAQVRSPDGATGRALGNERHANLLSLLEGLIVPFFLGKDARRLEHLVDEVYVGESRYKYAGMPFFNAIALIELAIFDLLSRRAGVPVHALLGKKIRHELPVYLSRFTRDNRPEQEAAALLEELSKCGATAVKIKLGARMSRNRDGYAGRSEAIIPHLRKALPAGTTIYADANGSFDSKRAIELGKLMQDHGCGFFEEPCPWQEYDETKRVADALDLAIAGGEQDTSLPQFAAMLRDGIVDIVQPDLLYCGGLIRALRVAHMAAAAGKLIVPHSPGTHLNPYLIQFAAVAPNLGHFLEQVSGPQIKNGKLDVTDEPGWGFDFEESGTVLIHATHKAKPVAAALDPLKNSVEARRAETLRWFDDHVYGRPPRGIRTEIGWQPAAVPQPAPGVAAEDGILTLTGAGGKSQRVALKLYRPADSKGPLPVALFICNRPHAEMEFRPDAGFWPMHEIVKAGWLTVAFNVKDVVHDDPAVAAAEPGMHLLDSSPPGPHRGMAVSAWAWVASQVRGHLIRRADVASERIAVIGHSRGGKAALLAGARDPGFALAYSNNSGCGGAAHTATKDGEKIADITKTFPNWFCERYRDFAGKEAELKFDQHHLLGCIAPRRVYVASASADAWADPAAEYRSCQLASPIHQFCGAAGLRRESSPLPAPGEKRHGGSIGYHLREGEHNLTAADWKLFLEFAGAPPE